jgi:TfoX/Sxy family transcriptional regulator of competence genes
MDNDVLYLKVDDSNRPDFVAAGTGPFRPYGTGGEVMQYYEVPAGVLENAVELGRWAAKAIAVARAKKAARPKKKRVPAKKTGRAPATTKGSTRRARTRATPPAPRKKSIRGGRR